MSWKWRNYPNTTFRLNKDVARQLGLIHWCPLLNNSGLNPIQTFNREKSLSLIGTSAWIKDPVRGEGISFPSQVNDYLALDANIEVADGREWTFSITTKTVDTLVPSTEYGLWRDNDVNNSYFTVGWDGYSNYGYIVINGDDSYFESLNFGGDEFHTWVFVCDGTNIITYLDRNQVNSFSPSDTSLDLRNVCGGPNGNWGGVIYEWAIFDRAHSVHEIFYLQENPWELYESVMREAWVVAPTSITQVMTSFFG